MRDGRVVGDGPKQSMLTAERLTDVFDAPIVLDERRGYLYARPG